MSEGYRADEVGAGRGEGAGGRVGLELPPGWVHVEASDGVAVAARGSEAAGTFPPTVVVTVEELGDRDLPSWQGAVDADLAATLDGYLLLDLGHAHLDGRPAVRRVFAHRLGGDEVTAEQWVIAEGGLGYTLTWTVATGDYPRHCASAEAWAERVVLRAA